MDSFFFQSGVFLFLQASSTSFFSSKMSSYFSPAFGPNEISFCTTLLSFIFILSPVKLQLFISAFLTSVFITWLFYFFIRFYTLPFVPIFDSRCLLFVFTPSSSFPRCSFCIIFFFPLSPLPHLLQPPFCSFLHCFTWFFSLPFFHLTTKWLNFSTKTSLSWCALFYSSPWLDPPSVY